MTGPLGAIEAASLAAPREGLPAARRGWVSLLATRQGVGCAGKQRIGRRKCQGSLPIGATVGGEKAVLLRPTKPLDQEAHLGCGLEIEPPERMRCQHHAASQAAL